MTKTEAITMAEIARCVATTRPLYSRAYIAALEDAGTIPPGMFRIHDGEMLHLSPQKEAQETNRGRLHAERGVRPTFLDTMLDTMPFADLDLPTTSCVSDALPADSMKRRAA